MKNLNFVTQTSPKNLFIEIVKNKQGKCREILNASTNSNKKNSKQVLIFKRYLEYKKARKSLEILSPIQFSKIEKACLLACYSSKTSGMRALQEKIRTTLDIHSIAHCPYCGLDSIQTFDHYLPKSEFPEFSVLSDNLIPCCYYCNNKKGENWSIAGKRLFIHYYFDSLPDKIFLYAKVTFRNGAPSISFIIKPPNCNPIYDIVCSHYRELDLIDKIEEKCNSYLVNVYNQNKASLQAGVSIEQIKTVLKSDIKIKEKSYGKNHWEVVINRALLKCPDYYK